MTDDLNAEWLVMKSVIAALIESHPNPELLRQRLDRGEQILLAQLVPTDLSEEFLNSLHRMTDSFRSLIPPTGAA